MQLSVTRRQYNDNEAVFASTFHWIKDQEGIFAWSEVGNYGEHYNNLGHEIIVSYQGEHWELELVKTVHPDQVFVDVILTDRSSHDRHYFNEDGYDEFIASANLDITWDHTTTTRVFWMRCHELLDQLLEVKENADFLTRLNICHQVYETKEFPGFGFHLEKPKEREDIKEPQSLEDSLSSVRIASEGVSPSNDSTTNNPPVDTSSNDSQSEYGIPVWIAAACKYEVEGLVDDEIEDQEEKPVAIGGEDNTQSKGNDELH